MKTGIFGEANKHFLRKHSLGEVIFGKTSLRWINPVQNMNLRKWNRIIHRDLGYFFVGMCLIYGLSGIALNHLRNWNPDYIITTRSITVHDPGSLAESSGAELRTMLQGIDDGFRYKSHYYPAAGLLKVFLQNGSVTIDVNSGEGKVELLKKRPVFREVNFLHYNKPKKLWTWFSDAYAVSLIFLAISGMFMIKGRKGFSGRGIWFVAAGTIIPLAFLFVHLWKRG